MDLRAVCVEKDGLLDTECRRLYRSSFPKVERIHYGDLHSLSNCGEGDLLAILDGHDFAGMAFMVAGELPCLLYFAVDPEFRGKGYGSRSLKLIRSLYDRFFLFAEDPGDEAEGGIRHRRLSFYARNGLTDIGCYGKLEVLYKVMVRGNITVNDVDSVCSGKEAIYLVRECNMDEGF